MRLLLRIYVISMVFLAASCSQPSGSDGGSGTYIRFQNMMTGTYKDLNYGVRMGDAVHEAALPSGQVTQYYEADAGSFSVQWKSNTGSWITVSAGSLSVTEGKYHTLGMTGDMEDDSIRFRIVIDK